MCIYLLLSCANRIKIASGNSTSSRCNKKSLRTESEYLDIINYMKSGGADDDGGSNENSQVSDENFMLIANILQYILTVKFVRRI